jgi:hypothetical protein
MFKPSRYRNSAEERSNVQTLQDVTLRVRRYQSMGVSFVWLSLLYRHRENIET